jgi:2-pyrone-4,6-dicarboxylate lactonase
MRDINQDPASRPAAADLPTDLAAALIAANPDQLVWGSDWPHPAIPQQEMPNDGAVLDALAGWVPDTVLRNRILAGNPARLYGFDDDA